MDNSNIPNGKQLMQMAQDMFGTTNITPEQLAYIMDMLRPSAYLLRNHSIRGNPMTFSVKGYNSDKARSHRPWQIDILNSTHKNLAVIKSRQLGISEIGVGKLIHFVDTHSYDRVKALYTFPTNKSMDAFVKTRLDPVLSRGYYSTIIDPDINSMKVKKIRDSFIYFRSSSTPGALEGIDVDFISLDEYDRVNFLAENSAMESLASSNYKIKNRWSTPSLPGVGISRLFDQSDQHWYLHKCEHCNYYNQLKYEEYDPSSIEAGGNIKTVNADGVDLLAKTVVDGSFQYVCQKCGKPLDRWYNGSWVAKYPERTKDGDGIRGYMISQLNAVWLTADDIKRKELASLSKQSFYNYVLGYSYEDSKMVVTESDVFNSTSQHTNFSFDREDYRFVSAGIDWGNFHWISIIGMKKDGTMDLIKLANVQKSGTTDTRAIGADLEQIKLILEPFSPDIIVADIGDSGDKVAKLIDYYGAGKVYGCKYNPSPKSTGQLAPSWNENNNVVTVDKLMQNKRYITMIKEGYIHHPKNRNLRDLIMYIDHWRNVTIRDEEDERTGDFYQVIGRKGDDHYAQASVYSMLGIERLKEVFYGSGRYGFNADFINLQYNPEPTKPDIFRQ